MEETARDRIIKVRKALGMKQGDFCKGIYCSHTYFSNLECGNKKLNDRIIALICSQYGVRKKYLVEGEGEMFSETLPDIQLERLLEIFNDLEKPFKEYIILQVEKLTEAIEKSRGKAPIEGKPESPTLPTNGI